jgi:uncharacterized membrane protein YkvA (DUF1232 family)
LTHWKRWAAALRENTFALYLASRDPRVPWFAKLVLAIVVGYALSPIDLIPDFIPVLGYLDDLLILPLGIALAIKLMPPAVWRECRQAARHRLAGALPRSRRAAAIVILIWTAAAVVFTWIVWQWLWGRPDNPPTLVAPAC